MKIRLLKFYKVSSAVVLNTSVLVHDDNIIIDTREEISYLEMMNRKSVQYGEYKVTIPSLPVWKLII
jgi:hypothetical protein